MSDAAWSVIGAVVGAAIAAGSAFGKDWLFGRKERSRHAVYLAVRVVCTLDEFIFGCSEVVSTLWNDPNAPLPKVHTPKFPGFQDDLDWKSISPDLMYEIISFPNDIKAADNTVEFVDYVISGPPNYEETAEERQYQYALLGLKAGKLADRLRNEYAIPRRNRDWKPADHFQRARAEIEARRSGSQTLS
jgi:hypothetical protein